MKILPGLYAGFQILMIVAVGFNLYVCFFPRTEAKLRFNDDQHTPLNHGQATIDITLPKGVTFSSFGGCYPLWQAKDETSAPSWHAITCSVERFNSDTFSYEPAPYERGWIEIVP